jgi:hypothetical protein
MSDNAAPQPPPLSTVLAAIGWAIVVAVVGGILCGWTVVIFGRMGLISLLLLGILAGVVSRRITGRGWMWVGIVQAAAVILAWFLADIYWLRYAEFAVGEGADSWLEAMQMFFTLHDLAPQFFFVGLVCTALGAISAYMRAGSKWQSRIPHRRVGQARRSAWCVSAKRLHGHSHSVLLAKLCGERRPTTSRLCSTHPTVS